MDEILADFIAETTARLDQFEAELAALSAGTADGEAINRALRSMHTVKGACGFLHLARVEAITHACEGALGRLRDGRASADTLPLLAHSAAQLRALLAEIGETGAEPVGDDHGLLDALGHSPNALDWAVELTRARDRLLSLAGNALHHQFAKLNAIAQQGPAALDLTEQAPIETAWKTLAPMAAELSQSLGKPIELELVGGETEIYRAALGPLKEALGHLTRNSADHGLEPGEEREALGKRRHGTIRVAASREGDDVLIRVADDGRGLDAAKLRHRAIAMGLCYASQAARLPAEDVYPFIFAPGFTTAKQLTRHSGRGIGLDAVRAAIESLGGSIKVESIAGVGTAFIIRIPPPVQRAPEPPVEAAPVQAPAPEQEKPGESQAA
jgi:two-component system chemotaxis sensor kinase CheA